MVKLLLRSILLALTLYTSYWLYLEYFPVYYNSATNNRWHFLRSSLTKKNVQLTQPLIFIGDSRLNAGVNFRSIDSCFNLSVGGASPIEMYFILKKYLDTYPTPRKVVLSQSPRFFMEIFSFWGFAVRNQFFEAEELSEILGIAQTLKDTTLGRYPKWNYFLYKAKYFDHYQPDLRASRIMFGKKRNNVMTAYMIKNNGKRPHPLRQRISSGLNYETQLKHFQASPLLDYYFKQLLSLCEMHNIETTFVNMPMNEASFTKLEPQFIIQFENYLRKRQEMFPKIMFELNLYAWPDSLFGDPSHLHHIGAKEYTKRLNKLVNNKSCMLPIIN